METLIPVEVIEKKIYLIRGHKVMLDKDLAELYSVPTKRLNEQVKRRVTRFPADLMFQLMAEEATSLRSQFAALKQGRGQHRKYSPFVFTEQGVAMLSNVLNSERAIQVNIAIMRAFVKLRELLSTHKELAHKFAELERKIEKHDGEIKVIFDAIRKLMATTDKPGKKIGFQVKEKAQGYKSRRGFQNSTN